MGDLEERIRKLTEKHVEAVLKNDYMNSLLILEELFTLDPNNSSTNIQLAGRYCNSGKHEKALYHAELANKQGLDDGVDYFVVGCCYQGLKYYQEAINFFLKAKKLGVETVEFDIDLNCNTGECYRSLGDWAKAIPYFEQAKKQGRDDCDLNGSLGLCYQTVRSYRKAVICLKRAIELNPMEISNYYNLSLSYTSLEDSENALTVCQNAMKINPNNISILARLGDIYLDFNEIENAEKHLFRAEEISEKDPEVQFQLGRLFDYKEQSLTAITHFMKSLCVIKESENRYTHVQDDSLKHLNILISDLGSPKEAMNIIENVFKETEDYFYIGPVLVSLLDYWGDMKRSKDVSKKIIEFLRRDPRFNLQGENVMENLGKKSSNPVQVQINNPFSENIYLIKTNDINKNFSDERKRLAKEYATLFFVNKCLEESPKTDAESKLIKVPPPFSFFEQNGRLYFFERRINQLNLDETALTKEQSTEEVKKALETMAQIHESITREIGNDKYYIKIFDGTETFEINLKPFDYMDALKKRFIGRLGERKGLSAFMEEYSKAMPQNSLEYFIHGDFHPLNVLLGGYIVDFERACIGDPVLDLSYFLEYPDFDKLNKQEMLEHYLNKLLYQKNKDAIQASIKANYERNALFNSLCLIGAKINQEDVATAKEYLIKSLGFMNGKLRNKFVEYINNTAYEELKEVI